MVVFVEVKAKYLANCISNMLMMMFAEFFISRLEGVPELNNNKISVVERWRPLFLVHNLRRVEVLEVSCCGAGGAAVVTLVWARRDRFTVVVVGGVATESCEKQICEGS